jgi:hypothetical protein
MLDRAQLHRINADQLVTRTDRILCGGLEKRRASRPAYVGVEERTVRLPPPRPRAPWRAMIFGAMFGVVAGAIAVAEISRHDADRVAIVSR